MENKKQYIEVLENALAVLDEILCNEDELIEKYGDFLFCEANEGMICLENVIAELETTGELVIW